MTDTGDTPSAGRAGTEIGLRNRLRSRWGALPMTQRAAFSIAGIVVLAIGLYFIDNSLAYGALTIVTLY
jgi:hypothetical protein